MVITHSKLFSKKKKTEKNAPQGNAEARAKSKQLNDQRVYYVMLPSGEMEPFKEAQLARLAFASMDRALTISFDNFGWMSLTNVFHHMFK